MRQPVLEVIACSVADAIAAEQGGAGRLEIISHFDVGGLTPPLELVRAIISSVKIPCRVMVRENESFFVYDEKIIERLCESARSLADLSVDGLVLGFLMETGDQYGIDHDALARVLSCAPDLKATFHHAFELLPDPRRAIAELKQHRQIDRILTSGGDDPWPTKIRRLAELQNVTQPEIEILAGGGVDGEAITLLRHSTTVREFHVGRAVRKDNSIYGEVDSRRVKALLGLIKYDGDAKKA